VTTSPFRLAVASAALVAGMMAVNACSSPSAPPSRPPAHQAAAGDAPSDSAKMICEPDAVGEVAVALGVRTSAMPVGTWSDHVYSCKYVYPDGVMVLSVKELTDEASTTAYYTAAQQALASSTSMKVLTQPAFAGPDGSLYVRKDFKVLHVDVAGLPEHLGQGGYSRADAAFRVAAAIMSCWTGA
jgi:hypothetical protein